MIRLEIRGRVRSKKNSRKMRVNYRHGYHYTVPSDAFEAYKESFLEQIATLIPPEPLKPPYHVKYAFYMKGKGATDGDNMEGSVNDIMQEAGIIGNDKDILSWEGKKILKAKEYLTVIEVWHVREDNGEKM